MKAEVEMIVNSFKPDKTNWPSFRGQDSRGNAGGSDYPTEWDAAAEKI